MAVKQKKCKCPNKDSCKHPWYDRVQKNGRRVWICLGTDSKSAANRIADKKRGDRALVDAGVPLPKPTVVRLLKTLTDTYLERARKDHPATADTKDAKVLASLLAVIGNKDITTITDQDIERWRQLRARTYTRGRYLSPVTVNRELHIVRGCFHFAEDQEWIGKSPCRTVKKWKTEEPRRRILQSPVEWRVVRDMPEPYATINLTTLLYLTRLSEVLRLTGDDLSPIGARKPYIEVRRKGGRRDKVFVDAAHMARLRAQLTTPEQEYLFPHTPRKLTKDRPRKWQHPWRDPSTVSVYNCWYFRQRGMHGVSNHKLRHTGTTYHQTEAHTDASTLQVMGGWTTRRMLDIYGKATEQSVQAATTTSRAHFDDMMTAAEQLPPVVPVRRVRKDGPTSGPRAIPRSA